MMILEKDNICKEHERRTRDDTNTCLYYIAFASVVVVVVVVSSGEMNFTSSVNMQGTDVCIIYIYTTGGK